MRLAARHEYNAPMSGALKIVNRTLQSRFDRTIECFMDFVEAAKHYSALKKQWVEFLGEHPNAATEREETAEIQAA